MALSSKISSIIIRQAGGSGWSYTIKTNNFTSDLGQVNYGSAFDEAIDGSLRHNFRGFRLKVSLEWAKITSSTVTGSGTTITAFLNSLTTSLTGSDEHVEISLNGGTNYHNVVPDNLSLKTAYTNQIGRGSSSMNFVGKGIETTIPSNLEAPTV